MSTQLDIGKRIATLALLLLGGLLLGAPAHAQNVAPVISGTPPTTAVPGKMYSFQPRATDANGDRLTFNASGLPGWAKFDRRTGRIWGAPSNRHLGRSYAILVSVTDGRLAVALPRFTVTVAATIPPPASITPAPTPTPAPAPTPDPDPSTLPRLPRPLRHPRPLRRRTARLPSVARRRPRSSRASSTASCRRPAILTATRSSSASPTGPSGPRSPRTRACSVAPRRPARPTPTRTSSSRSPTAPARFRWRRSASRSSRSRTAHPRSRACLRSR